LCVPNAGWHDDGRLFKLLEDSTSLKADETSPLRHLALLLHQEVAERLQEERRIEGGLRDERRRYEAQLRDEKHHAEELQGKLDSLMDIEREFSRRQRQKAPRP
jgi:rubrerythrin